MNFDYQDDMRIRCNHCLANYTSSNPQDFREDNNYPPSMHFVCPQCRQLAKIEGDKIPRKLFASLIEKISTERRYETGIQSFNKLPTI